MGVIKQGCVAVVITVAGLAAYHLAFAPADRPASLEDRAPALERPLAPEPWTVSTGVGVRLRVNPLASDPLNLDFK